MQITNSMYIFNAQPDMAF